VIKVTLFETPEKLGIDLNRISNTAMATIEVLKPGG
jgi:hypothetical protein